MKLGLPVPVIVGLGLLAAPRVVLHDLDVIHEGTAVNAALVFVPLVVWVVVAVWRATNPFLALLATGAVYGVCLAVGHHVFADLELGGNVADLPPAVTEIVARAALTGSSLFTGLAVGTVCGALAWALARLIRRDRPVGPGRPGDATGRGVRRS